MSLSDMKHTLRKYDFPQSAREALVNIEQILSGRTAPTNKQLDMVIDIIAEFVFCENDRRGNRRSTSLTSLQELQLIDVICEFLSGNINETTKNTIFLSLFGGSESQRRAKVLYTLASMAVSASNIPMLLAVGVWLQQMGCSSPQSLQLVENIIQDHFFLNTSNQQGLKALANSAPQFVANFITAVTELYTRDSLGNPKLPPKNLLEVITSWVYSNPTLCMSAQLNPAALPNGAIPMAAVTPLAGLVHWCALAPLYVDTDIEMTEESSSSPPKKIKIENQRLSQNTAPAQPLSESALYSMLHLSVLHSLRAGKRNIGPPTAVNAQHMAGLVTIIQAYAHHLMTQGAQLQTNDVKLQSCLDRIAQAVQVALAHGCIYGNVNHLLTCLDNLPDNRLLKIVINRHRQSL